MSPDSPRERLKRLLGRPQPLVQAPMAGVQGHALALAVHAAGALGSLPAAMLSPPALLQELQALQAGSGTAPGEPLPFNLNFFAHATPTPDAAVEARWREALAPAYAAFGIDPAGIPAGPGRSPFSAALADMLEPFRPAVVSFHFGLPEDALVAACKAWGAEVWSSATTVEEARWLEAHGADVVIAQGLEAGGHRGHFLSDDLTRQLPLGPLVQQIRRAVRVPVVAAGGIVDAAGVKAARALGADAVQVGTAFLLCPEARTSALHRAALTSDVAAHTALTNVFTGRPARGIVNRFMREVGPIAPEAPAFPLATNCSSPLRSAAEARGNADFTPLWAGQNAPLCRAMSAESLVAELVHGLR